MNRQDAKKNRNNNRTAKTAKHAKNDFLRDVVIKAHDLGFLMRFGKGIVKEHLRLRKRLDPDYYEGIKLGQRQVAEERNYYLEHRKNW